MLSRTLLSAIALLPALVVAQLSGTVGPSTSAAKKAATKTCDVTKYGAVADKSTDIGPPLVSAWADCKSGGVVVVPKGDYAIATWATLTGGSKIAIQLDGVIYRTGTAGGNMIFIENTDDFELFSSKGGGAIQGNGYQIHAKGSSSGARILRLYKVTNFSVHDLVLVDAPAFHFSMDTCKNGEVYNMAIRGGNMGGLDGIDVWSTNIWIHDVMVTNKDECVTVKSPATNILIENIYCNWSGGCALGSLGANTAISKVTYKNVYTWSSNQMLMIKSNGGSGYVEDVVFENFIGHGNAYSLDIDQYWSSMSTVAGDGVQLSNVTFKVRAAIGSISVLR
jgi:rhamnogalacturonan hydrolase